MAGYVDVYLIAVPKRNLTAYRKMARAYAKMALEYGATECREFVGDDLFPKHCISLTKAVKIGPGEVLISSVVGFKSRKHRDKVIKQLLKDPRMDKMMGMKPIFNMKTMMYGGFKTFVEG